MSRTDELRHKLHCEGVPNWNSKDLQDALICLRLEQLKRFRAEGGVGYDLAIKWYEDKLNRG